MREIELHQDFVNGVAVNVEGNWLFTSDGSGNLKQFSLEKEKNYKEFPAIGRGVITSMII